MGRIPFSCQVDKGGDNLVNFNTMNHQEDQGLELRLYTPIPLRNLYKRRDLGAHTEKSSRHKSIIGCRSEMIKH